jgi:hypothetical protein
MMNSLGGVTKYYLVIILLSKLLEFDSKLFS